MGKLIELDFNRKCRSSEPVKGSHTTVTYHDGGKGLFTRRCDCCDGSGRVYEGGYGMRDCPMCQ